jgi:hypothetical protein
MTNRLFISAAALLGFILATVPVRANVIFAFTQQTGTGPLAASPYNPQIVFSDAAAATGLVHASEHCALSPPQSCTGNLAGVVSFTFASFGFGDHAFDVTLLPNGELAGDIVINDQNMNLTETCDSTGACSGSLRADFRTSCSPCGFTGEWHQIAVPEPGTVLLMITALVPIGLIICLYRPGRFGRSRT